MLATSPASSAIRAISRIGGMYQSSRRDIGFDLYLYTTCRPARSVTATVKAQSPPTCVLLTRRALIDVREWLCPAFRLAMANKMFKRIGAADNVQNL